MVRTYTKENICVYPELRVLVHDTITTKDKRFSKVKMVWEKHYLLFRDTIKQIQSQGKISSTVNPSISALFFIGMLTWITYWLDFDRKNGIEDIASRAEETVFNALGLGNITTQHLLGQSESLQS